MTSSRMPVVKMPCFSSRARCTGSMRESSVMGGTGGVGLRWTGGCGRPLSRVLRQAVRRRPAALSAPAVPPVGGECPDRPFGNASAPPGTLPAVSCV